MTFLGFSLGVYSTTDTTTIDQDSTDTTTIDQDSTDTDQDTITLDTTTMDTTTMDTTVITDTDHLDSEVQTRILTKFKFVFSEKNLN